MQRTGPQKPVMARPSTKTQANSKMPGWGNNELQVYEDDLDDVQIVDGAWPTATPTGATTESTGR